MPQDMRIGVGVAAFVLRRAGNVPGRRGESNCEVLLGLRKGSHGAGLWSTPGGWLEFGESFESALRREMQEEVGLSLVYEPIQVTTTTCILSEEADREFVTIYMLLDEESWEGEVKLLEPEKCEEWRWFPVNRLPGSIWPTIPAALDRALDLAF